MAKVKYIYSGAPSWVTLREKDKKGKSIQTEVPLRTGAVAELDPENPYVASLLDRGLLAKCTDAETSAEAPAEAPTEAPAETPGEALTEAPAEVSEFFTTETSSKKGRR